MSTNPQFDVFISYSHIDYSFVDKILKPKLESWKLKVCLDKENFLPGQRLAPTIRRLISASRHVIFVCTKNFIVSDWCQDELEIVKSQDPAGIKAKAIPIVLEDGALPELLKETIWCNFIDDVYKPDEWQKLQIAFEEYKKSQPVIGFMQDYFSSDIYQPKNRYGGYRILVVDSNQAVRNICSNILYEEGLDVDAASSLNEAVARIKSKTYHVALIEILLSDDVKNVDGLAIMDFINNLDEGTKIICLSGQQDVKVACDVFTKYNAYSYITKSSLKGKKDILDPVLRALDESNIKKLDGNVSINSLLAGHKRVHIWEDEILNTIKPSGGYDHYQRFIRLLFDIFLPIKSPKKEISFLNVNKSLKAVYGKCWSKSIGKGIGLVFFNSNTNFNDLQNQIEMLRKKEKTIHEINRKNLRGIVFELDNFSQIDLFSRL